MDTFLFQQRSPQCNYFSYYVLLAEDMSMLANEVVVMDIANAPFAR